VAKLEPTQTAEELTMTSTFADLGVSKPIVSALEKRGISEPFPVQMSAIPDLLAGRDVSGKAPTGSGKTLAFGIPMLQTVGRAVSRKPRGLILAPTRELAEQIRRELLTLTEAAGRRVLGVYGGVAYGPQRSRLHSGVDIVVATPGRLTDLVEQGALSLEAVDKVVIDEADRMADMGFMPQVRKLLDMTADRRQTVLFSATLDGDVAELTRRYQSDPVSYDVPGSERSAVDARHFFWRVEHGDRPGQAARTIASTGPTMVFTRTRRGADRLADELRRQGIQATTIHGGYTQRQRNRALREFVTGRVAALVATDVAARGIHVDDVACVIHYDPPEDEKAYLHRSGRTARAGASGVVVSFIRRDEVRSARALQGALGLGGAIAEPDQADLGRGGDRMGAPRGQHRARPDGHRTGRPRNGHRRAGRQRRRTN
jgi:superfamily II DNA/RNA helicase